MKNSYEIRGNVTAVFINSKGETVETLIDTADVAKLSGLDVTWWVNERNYVQCYHTDADSKRHNIRLHRYLTNAPVGFVVDHVNRNPLDNRRDNLRIVSVSENAQNRDASSNSVTGVRGVRIVGNRFRAEVRVQGAYHHVGYFDQLDKAATAVSLARALMMPFSSDAAERRGGDLITKPNEREAHAA